MFKLSSIRLKTVLKRLCVRCTPAANLQLANHVLEQARTVIDHASTRLSDVRAQRLALEACTSISEIDAQANALSHNIRAIKDETLHALEPLAESLEEALRKAQRNAEASSFASMLHEVLAESAARNDAVVNTVNSADDSVEATLKGESVATEAMLIWEDFADNVGDAADRYASVMSHPEYLASKTARVLIEHGVRFLDAVEQCAVQQDTSAGQISQATPSFRF